MRCNDNWRKKTLSLTMKMNNVNKQLDIYLLVILIAGYFSNIEMGLRQESGPGFCRSKLHPKE